MKKSAIILFSILAIGFTSAVNATVEVKSTLENLQYAYNKELNDQAKFDAYAIKADEEGYKSLATLFRTIAKSEAVMADNHSKEIKKLKATPKMELKPVEVKSTSENLDAAMKDEVEDKDQMYPAFQSKAEEDKNSQAAMFFKCGNTSEASYEILLKQASQELESWKTAGKTFLVCTVCGYITSDMKIEKCPVCAAPRTKFSEVK